MTGREDQYENNLFFLCSFIEYVARITKNERKVIVNKLGKSNLKHIYELADVYHCENIDKTTDEFVKKCSIEKGKYDNVADCKYSVPSYWDIGRVYERLIIQLAQRDKERFIDILIEVFNSWIALAIDNYNSSMYYSNPGYIYESYLAGEPLKE